MTADEARAIAAASRVEQGLPPTVVDQAVVERIATLLAHADDPSALVRRGAA